MQRAIRIYTRVRVAHLYVKFIGELQQYGLKIKERRELSKRIRKKKS